MTQSDLPPDRNQLPQSFLRAGLSADDLKDPRIARRDKLRRIQELGIDPWGSRFDDRLADRQVVREMASQIKYKLTSGAEIDLPEISHEPSADAGRPAKWRAEQGEGEEIGPNVRVAGRIMLSRDKGKLLFITLKDWTGELQIFVGLEPSRRREFQAGCDCLTWAIDRRRRTTGTNEHRRIDRLC
jgi:lysyl-tRNA synthetase, class II